MKEQLLLLLQLQEIDARVQEVRASIRALPERLAPAKQDLAKLEAMLQTEKDQVSEAKAWRREQEDLIRQEDEAVKKAKAKLQAAKSAKDFAAASREVDNKRRILSEREEEVLKVIEVLERTEADIATHERDIKNLREQIDREEVSIAGKIRALEEEAQKHSAARDALSKELEESLLARYERALRSRGLAVAPVIGGVCQGCHMAVQPQLLNTLARLNSIETCPRCQRIMYRQDIFADEADAGAKDD